MWYNRKHKMFKADDSMAVLIFLKFIGCNHLHITIEVLQLNVTRTLFWTGYHEVDRYNSILEQLHCIFSGFLFVVLKNGHIVLYRICKCSKYEPHLWSSKFFSLWHSNTMIQVMDHHKWFCKSLDIIINIK